MLRNKDGTTSTRTLEDDDITDILRAMLAPTRAYGYTFSYFGGAQQSIQGHYMFYEVDQTYMGSVINDIQSTGANPHIHIVLGGRYTPSQKRIIENKREVDTKLYTDLMTWFIQESGHPGYESVTVPEECPKPTLVREETENKTLWTIEWMRILKSSLMVEHTTSRVPMTHLPIQVYMILTSSLQSRC